MSQCHKMRQKILNWNQKVVLLFSYNAILWPLNPDSCSLRSFLTSCFSRNIYSLPFNESSFLVRLTVVRYLWCMKELRQVKMSRGTMAHSVITLLNLDSSTLRESPAVSLAVWLESFSLLVKYWRRRTEEHTFTTRVLLQFITNMESQVCVTWM